MINALKVMILEDRLTDQELIKRQVLKYKPESVFMLAEDKQSFLEKLDWFLPDLILADYHLPGYNGLEALIYIKENKPFVPFIFVTGGLDPNDSLGDTVLSAADGFILKDDLPKFHILLREIMDRVEEKIIAQREVVNDQTQLKVKLLKVTNLLETSNHFEQKEAIKKLLSEIRTEIFSAQT